jgi:O-antigen/teichoic acid export membrane protein
MGPMMERLKQRGIRLLRWSEKYVKTDMVYLFGSGFWSNAGTTLATLGSLLLYIIFGHFLPQNVYGTYQYLLSVGAIIGAFTLTGMNAAVTRAVARGYEGSLVRAVQIQLKWNLLPLIGAWGLGAYYLAAGNATIGWGLFLIGIFVPLNNALNTYGAFLSGKKDFRRGFLYGLWWNIPFYAAIAIAACFFKSALILLVANVVSQAIGLGVAYWQTIRTFKPSGEVGAETLRYGGHLSAMGLFGAVVGQTDSIFAFHFLGAADLAIYSFATAVPDRISALFKFIPAAALPKFSEKSPREIRVGLAHRLLLGTIVSLLAALVYVIFAHFFFVILFPHYVAAVPFSRWYALVLATSMTGVLTNALTAAGNVRALYAFNITTPLVQLLLQIVGVLAFGLWGLIAAKVLANIFALLLGVILYWRIDSR